MRTPLCILAALLFIGVPAISSAQGFAGIQLRGGGASLLEEDVDSGLGYGFGARAFGGYAVAEGVELGVNFDYAYSIHPVEAVTPLGTLDFDWVQAQPSLGVLLRAQLGHSLILDLNANYVFGSVTAEPPEDSPIPIASTDTQGAQLGLALLYRWTLTPFATSFELGPYFGYTWSIDSDDTLGAEQAHLLAYGLAAQLSFELGQAKQ
ncbi:MAG: hypothetical protein RBU37_26190 [Myxococcota bacterium]|jgi:hypothetical protein|nr:hypothetical protein [Myxococcota bacterium]